MTLHIELVEVRPEPSDLGKLVPVSHVLGPAGAESMVYSFQSPKEVENTHAVLHYVVCEHSGEGSQIIQVVVKGEYFPASVAWVGFQELHI